jgi:hypothetical protein
MTISKQVRENLQKWDELTNLSEIQVKSIFMLGQSNESEQETNNLVSNAEQGKRETNNESAGQISSKTTTLQEVNEEVNELLYNFDISDIEDPRIEKYLNILNSNSEKCAQISEAIGGALTHLNVLLENYSLVSVKTKSLHIICEQLISDQVNSFYLLSSFLKLYLGVVKSTFFSNRHLN